MRYIKTKVFDFKGHSFDFKGHSEIQHVESRRQSSKGKNLWVPNTADLYILERPKTKIFAFERQKYAVCVGHKPNLWKRI